MGDIHLWEWSDGILEEHPKEVDGVAELLLAGRGTGPPKFP